jgi:NAD-dependent dihydropyrimidine dehydrogenase PreA subunit
MIEIIDGTKCTSCGLCVEACPLDALRMSRQTGKAYIAYGDDCMTCYVCEMTCLSGAIYVHPFKELLPPAVDYTDAVTSGEN